MRKQASGINDYVTTAAAAVVTAAFIGGVGGGMLISKLTQPGEYDKKNLQKQYYLSRLNKDNQTQEILSNRQRFQRAMRNKSAKSMRALG